MAQRTGAERLLASPAKTASAGVALALAVAALFLCGCGGGSSDPETAGTASGQATATAPDGGSPGSSSPSGSADSPSGPKATSAAQQAAEGTPSPGTSATGGNEGGAKHGPHITPPKGQREKAPTPAEKAEATVADMTLQSPSIRSENLTYTYTCDGRDISPALNWSGVPAGTKELILYVMNAAPVGGRLFFDWAVAGLDPASDSIEIGKLPPGAVVGTNSFGQRGYSICPPAGSAESYIFALFALPKSLSPQKGFDPRPLREEILDVSRNVGLLTAAYARE